MFNHAVAGQPLPKHLSTDHDPLFRFHRWLANLRVLRDRGDQVGSVRPSLASVRRTADRHDPARVSRSRLLLERGRPGAEAGRIQRLLQRRSRTSLARRLHARATRRRALPAPAALDHYAWRQHCRGLFDADRGVTINSPPTPSTLVVEDRSSLASPSGFQPDGKLLVRGGLAFPGRPAFDLIDVYRVQRAYQHSLIQGLTVTPVIESGKPVHDTLGWRQDLDSQITHRLLTPSANQVITDGQRPWWKFEGIRTCLVDEMPTRLAHVESKSLQYALKVALAR